MTNFTENQWYLYDGDYIAIISINQVDVADYRRAGEDTVRRQKASLLISVPASLTPDFSGAKVGDKCFHVNYGDANIEQIFDKSFYCIMLDTPECNGLSLKGYELPQHRHPTLFNSFAQHQAYWAEEGLKMRGAE